jgi:hypothetical protein
MLSVLYSKTNLEKRRGLGQPDTRDNTDNTAKLKLKLIGNFKADETIQ